MLLFLIVAINRELKKNNFLSNNLNLLEFLDLVALGTICDIVNLDTVNRAFVKQGLKIFKNSSNIGLLSILNEASIVDKVSCYHLGFIIGPRINAGGRVGSLLWEQNFFSHLIKILLKLWPINCQNIIILEK